MCSMHSGLHVIKYYIKQHSEKFGDFLGRIDENLEKNTNNSAI